MTRDELMAFAEKFYNNNIEISKRKNKDYTGHQEESNPFANFEAVETFGIATERGFITRMADKLMRINNLIDTEAAVKDESIADTLSDLANYCMLLAAYLQSKGLPEKE